MRARSTRTEALYRGGRDQLNRELEVDPRPCELGPRFKLLGGLDVCSGRATCWHERRKRSDCGSILKRANLMAACARCNQAVEDHPELARRLGFVAREGDPGWELLGRGDDR